MLIMIDGMDGSGKTTMVNNYKTKLAEEGNTIFDLKVYWKEKGQHPEYSELKKYDFIFCAEPTFVGMGKIIRDELIKNGNNYPAEAIAEAFSIDRLILYKKIIIPALADNKIVIMDRGVSTSLCYQTVAGLSLEYLTKLAGNNQALQYRPDYLVIFKLSPEVAEERLGKRADKKDDAVFEEISFQKRIMDFYESDDFKNVFSKQGTEIRYITANEGVEEVRKKSTALFDELIAK